jgi:hypothetical protein
MKVERICKYVGDSIGCNKTCDLNTVELSDENLEGLKGWGSQCACPFNESPCGRIICSKIFPSLTVGCPCCTYEFEGVLKVAKKIIEIHERRDHV